MKKFLKVVSCLLVAVNAMSLGVACGGEGGVEIDEGRTQLYVGNYDGGYGHRWLDAIIVDFEKEYAEVEFEKGKKGVQIIVENSKDLGGAALISTISTKTNEVYFTESADYYSFIKGGFLYEITDMVTGANEMDNGKTIESKMTDGQKGYYKTDDNKYYAVPHYAGFPGIQYNIDLFNTKSLYFAKNGAPSEKLQQGGSFTAYRYTNAAGAKSAGPDGKYDTKDDGLPATYAEFYKLMDEMVKRNVTPFVFTGMTLTYTNWLITALQADYMGKDNITATLNLDGSTVTDTLKIVESANGQYTDEHTNKKFDIVEAGDIQLTNANGYQMFAHKGKLEALRFIEKMVSNPAYYYKESVGSLYTAFDAQSSFLLNGIGTSKENPIAFLIDGIWWQEEATADFEYSERFGEEYSKENRNFGFMPLPKADESKIGEPTTILDLNKSTAFIASSIKPNKVELAKLFLKYCCTDAALNDFTKITGTPKGFQYELEDEVYNSLTGYSKSTWDLYNNADYMMHYSSNIIYKNDLGSVNMFANHTTEYATHIIRNLCPALSNENERVSAETAFKHINEYSHRTETGWKLKMRNYI